MRRSLLVAGLTLLLVIPAAAQRPGSWELGAFGRYNWYDGSFNIVDSTRTENSFGFGARLGLFVANNWALELDGSYNVSDVSEPGGPQSVALKYFPFHLRVIYNAPLAERFSWLIGAGPNYNRYHLGDAASAFLDTRFEGDDWGIGALTGFRYFFSERVSGRADLTYDYIPSPQNDPDGSNGMWGVQAGLSLHFGGRCGDQLDTIRVEPRNATVRTGEQVTFRVIGVQCNGETIDAGPGTTTTLAGGQATLTGLTFSSANPGTYTVRFENRQARRRSTDAATVTVSAPPPPPQDTLARIDLQPDADTIYVNERLPLRVMGHYAVSGERELTNCQVAADGGSVTAGAFAANAPGTYTVTAVCERGKSDRSTITVARISVVISALFEFDRTNVYIQAELDSLRMVARTLQEHPTLQLTLYGHADAVGSDAYNCRLGWRRIRAVLDTLQSFGVAPDRMQGFVMKSYGERTPVADNSTRQGRVLNRRVEIFDTPTAKQYDPNRACPAPPS